MKRALTPAQLTHLAVSALGEDVDDFDYTVASPHGQVIEVVTPEGQWPACLFLEQVGYTTTRLPWSGRIHSNPLVEWIIRSWIIDRIQTTVSVGTIRVFIRKVDAVKVVAIDPNEIEKALFAWIEELAAGSTESNRDDVPQVGLSIYQWALEVQAVPGFKDWRLYKLKSSVLSASRKRYSSLLTLRDPLGGPYTRPELARIEQAISSSEAVSNRQRAEFYLCRDWGVRPIQLALMRVSDVGEDAFGHYVDIPSVKGARAALRRADGNMVRRHISNQAAEAIHRQVGEAGSQVAKLQKKVIRCLEEFGIEQDAPPLPMFPLRDRGDLAIKRFCEDPALYPYTLHANAGYISREMREIGIALRLLQEEVAADVSGEPFLTIGAYRLRRTKGTSMAIMGCSREEVAEALDHATKWSVEHYFRYSSEVHDLINATAASSQQIVEAASMWQGRYLQDDVPEPGDLPVGGLGRCKLKAPCPHHPRVSCYACHRFRPDKDADHAAALEEILAYDQMVRQTSTGPVRNQLSLEVSGAMSLVEHLRRQDGEFDGHAP
ncbi:hypothetical protein [Stenotrophomonas sp.]|uniref:hypothetical protein n=1 Tax=Stenotrophomonas sp. TaxID=69392 RepID=UPI0028AFD8BE|nr:hypothetical protein [Stenotrophomonas sp.]